MSLRSAWECFNWPEQTVYQQEFFAANYSAAQVYSGGMVVYYPTEQKYYQYVGAINSNNPPTLNGPGGTLNSQFWALAQPSYGSTATWDTTTVYNIGDIVLYPEDQEYYQLVATATAGTVPTQSTYWGNLNKFLRYVNQQTNPDGTTRTVQIGETFSVWPADPRITWRQQEPAYTLTDAGILIGEQLPFVWIEFRKSPPLLSTAGEATAYAFPYRFCEVCSLKAAGQMLRVDGKVDLGNTFLELGEVELSKEIDKVALQEKYVRQIIVPGR
jgi:hypothetical protein